MPLLPIWSPIKNQLIARWNGSVIHTISVADMVAGSQRPHRSLSRGRGRRQSSLDYENMHQKAGRYSENSAIAELTGTHNPQRFERDTGTTRHRPLTLGMHAAQ